MRHASACLAAAVIVAGAAGAARADAPDPKGKAVAIIDLQPLGVDAKMAQILTEAVASQAAKVAGLKVVSKGDVRALLTLEKERQLLGCAEDKCQADVAKALGTDWILAGSLSRKNAEYSLVLKLLDVKTASALGKLDRKVKDESALPDAARELTALLLTGKAREDRGTVSIKVDKPGASVTVDGNLVGLTPLEKPQMLQEGPHEVKVHLDGYAEYVQKVDVKAGQAASVDVALQQVTQARAEQSNLRMWSYVAMGVGVGAIGAGSFFGLQAKKAYGDASPGATNASNTYLGATSLFDMQDAQSRVKQQVLYANIGFGLGAAALATGGTLFVLDLLAARTGGAAPAGK